MKGGGRGLWELRSLFSSVNYDSSSFRPRSVSRERALIVSKWFEDFILECERSA